MDKQLGKEPKELAKGLGQGNIELLIDLVTQKMNSESEQKEWDKRYLSRLVDTRNKLLLMLPKGSYVPTEELPEGKLTICPKCSSEGKEVYLSEPYLTDEGWVQECPEHGRLYVWGRVLTRKEENVLPG